MFSEPGFLCSPRDEEHGKESGISTTVSVADKMQRSPIPLYYLWHLGSSILFGPFASKLMPSLNLKSQFSGKI
jgi:hypothetical protein